MALLEKEDSTQALTYLLNSLNIKDDYPPALYELAKIYYSQNELDNSFRHVNTIVYRSNADQNMTNKTIEIANQIFNAYSLEVNQLIQKNKVSQASHLLSSKYEQCLKFKKVSCLSIFEKDFSKVYNAQFENFNNKLIEAVNNDDFVLAENYADSTNKFISEFSKYLNKVELFSNSLNKLYQAYLTKSKLLLQENKSETALILLTSAKRLCTNYNYIVCTEENDVLIERAKTDYYQMILNEAKAAYENNELEKAQRLVEKADIFQTKNKLEPSQEIIDLYCDTAANQGVELTLETEGDPATAPLDPDGIEACITNLVSNGIDAAILNAETDGKVFQVSLISSKCNQFPQRQ